MIAAIFTTWASISSWFTPTVLFCLVNLTIVISLSSNFKSHHKNPPYQNDSEGHAAARMRKSASEKWREAEKTAEDVDSQADDFINRLKQQLKLQRLRHREMLTIRSSRYDHPDPNHHSKLDHVTRSKSDTTGEGEGHVAAAAARMRKSASEKWREAENLQQHSGGRRDVAAKSFCSTYDPGIHTADSFARISFEVLETLPTREQRNDCVPLLSPGRLTLEDCVQQEKSPDLPRVTQINKVEQRLTKLPRYVGGLIAKKWATRKGYSLGEERPFEVRRLSMDEKLDSRLQLIHMSQLARSSPRALALQEGGEIVRPTALSSSEFAPTDNRARLVSQDQSGSTASHYKCKNSRETSDKQGLEDLQQHFGCEHKHALKSLGDSLAWKSFKVQDDLPLGKQSNTRRRSLMQKHCVRLKKSQDLPRSMLRDCAGGLAAQSDIGLPDGGHILSLSEKKIVRKTLKRKCRTMSVLSLEDHQQHVGRRWEDTVKFLGAKRICRQLVIHRETTAKRIRRQLGTCRWLFKQSAIGLPDGGHILYLPEKKIVRKTLKRKCRSISVLSLEDHKQHVDRRWEDAAKSHGTKHIRRQLVIHRLSTAKRTHKQHGIHQWPFQQSAIGLPDRGHILSLSEKKIVRKTLKRKCRSMSVLSLVDRQQHVGRRWEDAAKNIGAKCICRQLLIHCVSIAKRIYRQHGIHHRWPFERDRGTMKGYTLGDERPVEVIRLSTDGKLVSRLQVIYISWLGRFSPPPSTLPGGDIVGHIVLSSSQFGTTSSIAQRVGQDQNGSASSDSENERTREQENPEEIYTSITKDDLLQRMGRMNRKDAAASLGISVPTFKRIRSKFGIKRWPHVRKKKVSKPPDQHGERNPPSTCKTLSTNGQTEMENEMVGHLTEMNEFLLDFDDGPNEAGVSSEWASQLRNQWTVSTTHPNSSGLVVPHPHMASQILGENMGSLEEWGNSFASLEEPLLPSHDSGSTSTVPPCSYPVPSQPMPTTPHTLGSSEDRRNSLAFLEDVFPEEHVSGSLLASVEDVSLEEHVHTMGSLLASAEEHFSVGPGFGFINQIVPSCFDPAQGQSMPNTLHTMPPIPHMMPLLTERQDTRSVMLKATYGDITIKFQLPLTCGIGKLKEEVSKRLECEPSSYHVEYKDEDGTWIIINCDEDVRIFLDLFTSLRNPVIELRVRDKVPNTTKFCQCGRSLKRKRP